MSFIFEAAVDFRSISLSPTPPAYPSTDGIGGHYFMVAGDLVGHRWIIAVLALPSQYPAGAPTVNEWKATGFASYYDPTMPFPPDITDPIDWTDYATPVAWTDADGQNGASYFTSSTLSITKDSLHDQITFSGPFGTATRSLSESEALNESPIYPQLLGHGIYLPVGAPGVNCVADVHALNMFAYRNGNSFFGHSLALADPAPWNSNIGRDMRPVGPGAPGDNNQQLVSDYLLEWLFTPAGFLSGNAYYRYIGNGEQPPWSNDIDMDQADEHGVVWRGGPAWAMGTDMWVQKTHDNAHSWTTVTAFSDPTTTNSSPSVCWEQDGMLRLTWHNGTNIVEALSGDLGNTWAMPTTIPFTGTWPRRIVSRQHGFALYFYLDIHNHLQCVRTHDNGASFEGPFTVYATTALPGGAVDAEFMPDSTVVVSFYNGANWTQMRSRDLGRNWF